jgi:hypothetical protein
LNPLAKVFNKYDLIIAPGDSPTRYTNALELTQFFIPPIIQIPISGLGQPVKFTETDLEMIYVYIKEFLQVYGIDKIDPKKIAFFEQNFGG